MQLRCRRKPARAALLYVGAAQLRCRLYRSRMHHVICFRPCSHLECLCSHFKSIMGLGDSFIPDSRRGGGVARAMRRIHSVG